MGLWPREVAEQYYSDLYLDPMSCWSILDDVDFDGIDEVQWD